MDVDEVEPTFFYVFVLGTSGIGVGVDWRVGVRATHVALSDLRLEQFLPFR